MAHYVQYSIPGTDQTMLVEVSEDEGSQFPTIQEGIQKASGLEGLMGPVISKAKTSFEDAIQQVLSYNAQVFIQSVANIPIQPSEAEITFGFKITGEAGNIAIGKIGGESNYEVRLTWKRDAKST